MKYIKPLFSFAIMAILFSSCGSLSISQKRYSNGLNISWFGGKDEVKATPAKKKKQEVSKSVAENTVAEPVAAEPIVTYALEEVEAAIVIPVNNEVKSLVVIGNEQHSKSVTLNTSKETQKVVKHVRKVNALKKALQLTKVQETHDGGGALKTIGWIFIILGIIFVLIVSILIGVLFMLLGLLFVIAGK